jgi:hypothetical protein
MSPELESLADEEILGVLRRARVLPHKGALALQRLPHRPERRDSRRRAVFTVWAGPKPVAHLNVGPALAGLHRRSLGFHRHNPQIGCCPLFFFRHAGVDFFGQEYLGKFNLEEALSARAIDPAGWQQAVRDVAAALTGTTQPSTLGRLTHELARFENEVMHLDSLNRLDHVFLRESVFPLVRLGALKQPPATAWSNGDFIAKNILLDSSGRARLVDYEFAHRTHFAAADWFRLTKFSQLPESATLESLAGLSYLPPWLEIRCWLDHAVKMAKASSLQDVQNDLPKISRNLARLVEHATSRHYDSVFFSLAPAHDPPLPALAVPDDAMAVEWSRHGSLQAHLTARVDLQPNHWSEVRVDMSAPAGRALHTRLRLPAAPCIVELRSVEVHGRERNEILWTVPSAHLDSVMTCSGNILETPTADGLGLVHFGGEAVVGFPPIRLAKSENAVGLAFWMRYVPTVADFTHRLRQAFASGDVPAILSGGQAIARIEGTDVPPREVVAQVFFTADDHYREEDSIRIPLPETNAWTELSFNLPALPAGAVIRLDPVDQPGTIEIERLSLEPAGGALSRHDTHARAAPRTVLDGLRCENDAVLIPDDEAVRILAFGPDPVLKLAPLEAGLADRPTRLKLAIRYSPQVPASLWSTALRQRCDETIHLNVRLHDETLRRAALANAETRAEALEHQLAQQAAAFTARSEQAARESRLARTVHEEQTARLERTIEDLRTRGAEDLRQAMAREAENGGRLTREIQAHEATRESLADTREAHAKEREVAEEKHAELVECLHAQNARLLDVEYRAGAVGRQLDHAQAEIARLHATLAAVGQRWSVRLDRKASRLLTLETASVSTL